MFFNRQYGTKKSTDIDVLMDFAKLREIIETTIYLSLVENHEFVIKAAFGEGFAALMEIDGKVPMDIFFISKQVNLQALVRSKMVLTSNW
jgi:hypothetical protein